MRSDPLSCTHPLQTSLREELGQIKVKVQQQGNAVATLKTIGRDNYRVTENYSREPQSRTISYAPSKVANGICNITFFLCIIKFRILWVIDTGH